MILPTFSWGASCIVPAKDLEIAGLYPGEPVNQYIAKLNGEAINIKFDNKGMSHEGTLDFDNVKYVNIKNLGEAYIGHIAFNIDTNKIVSYAFGSSGEHIYVKALRLIKNTQIPLSLWKIDNRNSSFKY